MADLINFRSPAQIRRVMTELDFSPTKTLGQNFLIDGNIADLIMQTAAPENAAHLIEVGGGLGTLTDRLASFQRPLHCIEKDDTLSAHLTRIFSDHVHVTILHQDALKVDFMALADSPDVVFVSNLPYSVGSRILMNIFMAARRPVSITVTVQRDVAERICASHNCRRFGLLSLWAQLFYDVEIIKHIPATCFHPVPRVESTLIHGISRAAAPVWDHNMLRCADSLTHAAFQQRRKQIGKILRHYLADSEVADKVLKDADIPGRARPEQIDVPHWIRLIETSAAAQLS